MVLQPWSGNPNHASVMMARPFAVCPSSGTIPKEQLRDKKILLALAASMLAAMVLFLAGQADVGEVRVVSRSIPPMTVNSISFGPPHARCTPHVGPQYV